MSRPQNLEIESSIISAAIKELSATEPENVTMRRVAKRAGITATTIYYYYENREELFEAVKFRYIDELASRLEAGDPGGAAFVPRLRLIMRSFADWCFSNPRAARLVMARLPANLSPAPEKLARYYRANESARALFLGAVRAGELASADPELDLAAGLGALWGAVQLGLDHRFDPSLWSSGGAVVDRAIDLFLAGLSAGKAGR